MKNFNTLTHKDLDELKVPRHINGKRLTLAERRDLYQYARPMPKNKLFK